MRCKSAVCSLLIAGATLWSAPALHAQDPAVRVVSNSLMEGPADPQDFHKWLADMKRWRHEQRVRIGYDDAEYKRPELKWTQSSYMQPQMMIEDRYFYDPVAGKYTVDRYLDDLENRYGGIDAVLVWPTYPNIGIDSRNQFDMFHDMPGGIDGIKQMVADFHRRHVRVLFPVMLWDQGTHNPGKPEAEALAEELTAVNADGVNGDTMIAVPRSFRIASDKTGHPLAFEPEHLTQDEALAYNNMDWAQAEPANPQPKPGPMRKYQGVAGPMYVNKYKWLETRHMTNISDRWQRDKNVDLQYAFFNGVGMETWENIWGIWNGMTERDSETVRRIAKIERHFSADLVSADWEPHWPMLRFQVYASKWPGDGETLWTIVNRNEFDLLGEQMEVPVEAGMRYFDVWHGVELRPAIRDGKAVLSFDMEAEGFGAILATKNPDEKLHALLGEMKKLNAVRLDSFSKHWSVLPQKMTEIAKTKPAPAAPEGMVKIPAASFNFEIEGIEIEGGNIAGVDFQYPWENIAQRRHKHWMQVESFYIDKYPVTNAQFKKFMDATKYHPRDDHNFLKDWKDGTYPAGWEQKPVTWVSLEDARAYAAWAGKRLPHEWEWQLAAQGTDGRSYPWGDRWNAAMVPKTNRSREASGPENVNTHPQAASPYGVEDLVGNVWQWTDEYMDDHTRAAVLRGGSYYKPMGSLWYFPQAYALDQHGKYLMMSPGRDRAATIGFRCVVDAR
ncbi:MAG: SUMF1/EgtB/PvdO family nonheme iron enzyme [Acidobacteria bacterium]|nr:SUMF1/EgtB/PvdO family nonheme iron enzyme [Acidobacteriota bacterium]